jgi:hypothetical protein
MFYFNQVGDGDICLSLLLDYNMSVLMPLYIRHDIIKCAIGV